MLHGLHIPEHAYGRHGTRVLDQPRRTRKLLMHRSEIDKIIARLGEAGVALVPLLRAASALGAATCATDPPVGASRRRASATVDPRAER